MCRQASLLFLLLSVAAAVAQIQEESSPVGFRRGYTILGRCRRTKSPDQRRRVPTAAWPTPTLEEHPSFAATKTQNHESTIFHRRERCSDGFKCLRGRCRKQLVAGCRYGYAMKRERCRKMRTPGQRRRMTTTATPTTTWVERTSTTGATIAGPMGNSIHSPKRCRDGYVMVGGRCRAMWWYAQQSRMTTTAAPTDTWEEGTSTTAATTPGPTVTSIHFPNRCRDGYVMAGGRCRRMWTTGHQSWMTTTTTTTPTPILELGATMSVARTSMMSFPNRCRDGYIMIGGQCRRMWALGQQSLMTQTTEPVPNLDLFLKAETTESSYPTIFYSRARCRNGYANVRGRCRRVLTIREARSADSQRTAKSEKVLTAAVSADVPLRPL